jgi:hypothetical protein
LVILLSQDLRVLSLLLLKVELKFLILLLSDHQSVFSVLSRFFDQLKSLDCFSFDLTVVALHIFQIVAEFGELAVKEVFKKSNILSFGRVSIQDVLDASNVLLPWRNVASWLLKLTL